MGRMISCAVLAIVALASPLRASGTPPQPEGLWLNPRGSVAVRTGPCGDKLCGWIVWASPAAQTDADAAGTRKLLGIELLEDYRSERPGAWSGTVYVPDMGRHFHSTMQQTSATQLRIAGCILGGLICKSQVWTKIERVPHA